MSRRLQLSSTGVFRYRQWRDSPATEPEEIALVLEVLLAISEDGWPPTITRGAQPVPRWPYFRDPIDLSQWIIAASADLWVVVQPEADSFDFVTAMQPAPEQEELADWLTDPSEPGPED